MKDSFFQYHHSKIVWCLIMMREHFSKWCTYTKVSKCDSLKINLKLQTKVSSHFPTDWHYGTTFREPSLQDKKMEEKFFFSKMEVGNALKRITFRWFVVHTQRLHFNFLLQTLFLSIPSFLPSFLLSFSLSLSLSFYSFLTHTHNLKFCFLFASFYVSYSPLFSYLFVLLSNSHFFSFHL